MDSSGQSAYEQGHDVSTSDVDFDIQTAMFEYATKDLGLNEAFAVERAKSERHRTGPKRILDELESRLGPVAGRQVLDLGAGLGGLSEELILRGAHTTALEPGTSWASLCHRRSSRHDGKYTLFQAKGEDIPLDDKSIDLVVSLQVLEHVQDPKQVLREVYRVLRPGGYFYLACENYLSFREGHYRIAWLPLLPKAAGARYLRARGRPPKFLRESVTYVTYPQIIWWASKTGFIHRDEDRLLHQLLHRRLGTIALVRAVLNHRLSRRGLRFTDRALRVFKFGVSELFERPT